MRHHVVGHLAQASPEERFHDDSRYAALHQLAVQVLSATRAVGIVMPVAVVGLYLYEVPVILLVVLEQPVEDSHVTVEREAQIPDASCLALLHEPLQQAVVEVALVQCLHASTAHGMQQEVIYIVGLQVSEAVLKHLLPLLQRVLLGAEVA